jgi:hypothetical protein
MLASSWPMKEPMHTIATMTQTIELSRSEVDVIAVSLIPKSSNRFVKIARQARDPPGRDASRTHRVPNYQRRWTAASTVLDSHFSADRPLAFASAFTLSTIDGLNRTFREISETFSSS